MADRSLPMQSTYPERHKRRRPDWSAIWGGAFVFAAIWAVFESLAFAIFGIPAAWSGMGAGMAIWTVVLTIIAMYIAGIETGRMSGAATRHEGLVHGVMMFGLCTVGVGALTSLAAAMLSYGAGVVASTHSVLTPGPTTGLAWTGFLSLILGWLAAMGGASSGVEAKGGETRQPVPMNPAA